MRKIVKIGWMKDRRFVYDCETGENLGKHKGKDETLLDFSFGLEGTLYRDSRDRIVLHLPLIAQKKSFWRGCSQKSRKVKVTIEFV